MSSNSRNKDNNAVKKNEIVQQILPQKPKPQTGQSPSRPDSGRTLSSNVSTATFSSMSKQAESLVNG